jgi:transcriptional regulator with XRE-family HTH domain
VDYVLHPDTRSSRHTELAEFLVSRRTLLLPESCGLPHRRRRRRTPGLRREEVSALAGISTAYYTWIEQGRPFDVSTEILEAIARALQLNEVEASHLFTLAGKATPPPIAAMDAAAAWQEAICQFVRLFEQGPALVLTPWLEVAEINPIARKTLGIDTGVNLAMAVFCGDGAATYRHGEALGGALVALLRRNHIKDIDNESFKDIIDTLHVRSAAFKKLWDLHIVDTAPLFEVEIERAGVANACFHGLIVSDPIAAKQFAVVRKSSN